MGKKAKQDKSTSEFQQWERTTRKIARRTLKRMGKNLQTMDWLDVLRFVMQHSALTDYPRQKS